MHSIYVQKNLSKEGIKSSTFHQAKLFLVKNLRLYQCHPRSSKWFIKWPRNKTWNPSRFLLRQVLFYDSASTEGVEYQDQNDKEDSDYNPEDNTTSEDNHEEEDSYLYSDNDKNDDDNDDNDDNDQDGLTRDQNQSEEPDPV